MNTTRKTGGWRSLLLMLSATLLTACSVTVTTDENGERRARVSEGYASDTEAQWLSSEAYRSMNLPFSEAVRAGNLLFLSGQIGIVPGTGKLAPGGITAETTQTLENIRMTLEKFGSSMDRVVKCTVFLAEMNEWAAMNDVYREFFSNPPARSALGASGLAMDARVEIECIALP